MSTKMFYEYEQDVLIGGNHLASSLIAAGLDPGDERTSTYESVLERFGQPAADMWVAWKAIMEWRDTVLKER